MLPIQWENSAATHERQTINHSASFFPTGIASWAMAPPNAYDYHNKSWCLPESLAPISEFGFLVVSLPDHRLSLQLMEFAEGRLLLNKRRNFLVLKTSCRYGRRYVVQIQFPSSSVNVHCPAQPTLLYRSISRTIILIWRIGSESRSCLSSLRTDPPVKIPPRYTGLYTSIS